MKCPSCQQTMANVDLERGPVGNPTFGPLISGFTAVCPRCRAVLGVIADPDAVAQKVVQALTKKGKQA
jgi:hypothetical protein